MLARLNKAWETAKGSLLCCFLSGAVFSLPFFIEALFPFTFVGLFCFFWLLKLEVMETRQFKGIFCFFLGFYLCLCSWFFAMYPLSAFGLSPALAWLVIGFCCVFVPLKMALQHGVFLWLGKFLPRNPYLRAVGYGCLWVAAEVSLHFGILAFPWGTVALSQTGFAPLIQTVSLFGSEWIAFFAVTFCALAVEAVKSKAQRMALVTSASFILPVMAGYLLTMLGGAPASTVPAAVIQGNISTEEKWGENIAQDVFETYAEMAKEAAEKGAKVILLPETAIPVKFNEHGVVHETFAQIAKEHDCTIIMGIFRKSDGKSYNSLVAIDAGGNLSTVYDKRYPVPFGEYMPMGEVLEQVFPALAGLNPEGTITPGETPIYIENRGYRMGCYICFDTVFGGREGASCNADFNVVVTNDGWFGDSAALAQHLRHAKLRAVESGKSLLRAANTGISAIIDKDGSLLQYSGILTREIVYGDLPLYQEKTVYGFIGDVIPMACILYLICIFGYGILKKYRK